MREHGESMKTVLQFMTYGVKNVKEKSGAYLFIPDGQAKVMTTHQLWFCLFIHFVYNCFFSVFTVCLMYACLVLTQWHRFRTDNCSIHVICIGRSVSDAVYAVLPATDLWEAICSCYQRTYQFRSTINFACCRPQDHHI